MPNDEQFLVRLTKLQKAELSLLAKRLQKKQSEVIRILIHEATLGLQDQNPDREQSGLTSPGDVGATERGLSCP